MYKGISAPFIHPPNCDHAHHGGGASGRPGRVPVVASSAATSGQLSHHHRLGFAARRFPDTMAASVAQPLERQIAQIPGVSQMTSTSSLGATAVTVQFDLNRNIDAAANDIQAAINAAAGQLPKDLPSPPTYRKVNPSDTPILILSVQSDVAPVIDVDDAAENILAQHLSQISGVSLVRVGGQQTPAIRIQIDPAKLVEKGMQLEDVRTQIGIATADSPKGALIGPKQTFTIQANDQLTLANDRHRLSVRRHTQRILSAAGHRHSLRNDEIRAGRFLSGHVSPATGSRADRDGGSGRRYRCDGAWVRRRRGRAEHRPHVHSVETVR